MTARLEKGMKIYKKLSCAATFKDLRSERGKLSQVATCMQTDTSCYNAVLPQVNESSFDRKAIEMFSKAAIQLQNNECTVEGEELGQLV